VRLLTVCAVSVMAISCGHIYQPYEVTSGAGSKPVAGTFDCAVSALASNGFTITTGNKDVGTIVATKRRPTGFGEMEDWTDEITVSIYPDGATARTQIRVSARTVGDLRTTNMKTNETSDTAKQMADRILSGCGGS
jgi:hypothetical protein